MYICVYVHVYVYVYVYINTTLDALMHIQKMLPII